MIYGGWLGVEGLSKKGLMEMDDSVDGHREHYAQ